MDWQDDFSVGVPEFDRHHQYLINLINEAHDACLHGQQKAKFNRIVNELAEYVSYHFTAEEQYMEAHNYPDLNWL